MVVVRVCTSNISIASVAAITTSLIDNGVSSKPKKILEIEMSEFSKITYFGISRIH